MTDYFNFELPRDKVAPVSNLGLAHIGDAVFELMVRTWLCSQGKCTAKGLHKATVRYVAAPAQAQASEKITPILTEEEEDVFRRGRNACPHSIPKNASRGEYQTATALEALFGWLYLTGQRDRLNELFDRMMEEQDHGA